ncbi:MULTISPECIES: putative cytokinetic ring protein SteA [Actinomycetaceae]|uniref:putative cytokinetic ring protein SteA n=1 Tax=Actinomycetaceae TaxID=2049 RepID=UPI0026594226|nr:MULTISPECIES: putative cytokinetic ring protein SteA [Actinomycetaceae]MDK7143591.1 putative cytokinetic ring protein SteA [Gleimia europaea]MDU6679930.1 putative cytokinetic ring protein SteA [Actinomyces sp.]
MKRFFKKAKNQVELPGEGLRVRVDERTKKLARRLEEGEIAVIDHEDIDRVAAESLVAAKPVAVLNAAKSTTGRYPNLGPSILLESGIILIDDLGPDIMTLHEGQVVSIDGDSVFAGDKLVAQGIRQTTETNEQAMALARDGMSSQIEAFAANTMEYLARERDLLLNAVGIPDVKTKFKGRHMLVVVRGYHYKEDLALLKAYIRDYRPVLVGVDGGADAILESGFKPDMIIGDMDSVSDKALTCGAEIVVHAYRDGRAPGLERVERIGVEHVVFPATGTSEDAAMLLGDAKGASLIVTLGTHTTLVEFLDKGRSGMASTFFTRLVVGPKLVDAKGVSRIYRTRISSFQLFMLSAAGILALIVALAVTPAGQTFLQIMAVYFSDVVDVLRGWLGLAPGAPLT